MKLLFLHGSPATGKLTVAKALLQTVQGRLFDNHAAIDLARTIFEFGAPGFWELVHSVRYAAFDTAAEQRVADQDHGYEQHSEDGECATGHELTIGCHGN